MDARDSQYAAQVSIALTCADDCSRRSVNSSTASDEPFPRTQLRYSASFGMNTAHITIRSPANAASAAICSLVLLVAGLLGPFMVVTVLGEAEPHSILSGIHALWSGGHASLAIIIALFSVAFPLAKIFFLVSATTSVIPLQATHRRALVLFAEKAGKYSLLDVLVIAVLIASFQSQEHAKISAGWATWVFAGSIAISIGATYLLPHQAARTN